MTSSAAIGAYAGCAGTLHALAGAGAHDAFGGNEVMMQYLLVFHRERVASLLALLEGLEGQWGGVTIRADDGIARDVEYCLLRTQICRSPFVMNGSDEAW